MSNWTRTQLKERAKDVLRQNYWIAFVVALILAFVTGGGGGSAGSAGGNNGRINYTPNNEEIIYDYDGDFQVDNLSDFRQIFRDINFPGKNIFIGVAIGTIIIIISFATAISVFLFNPLAVGCYKFFSTSAESPHKNMTPLGVAFRKGNYWGIVAGMFLKNLYLSFWFLLFIIPGIIKAYAYRMVPYILADNPQMGANEAITLSRKMMDGEKWNAFVLDLSFLGWYILGFLAFCIGGIFVNPYKFSTDAQLYLVLRDKAINNNYCTPGMLNLKAN